MSFYPPGWDYERVMNCAAEDFETLTEEQHTTLLNGLKEAGLYQAFADKVHKGVREALEAQRLAEEATKTDEQKLADREIWAPYIDTLKNVFKFHQGGWSEWGFVIFRATPYGPEHDARWAEYRRRWDQIIEDDYADERGFHPKSDRAIELLRFRWVEDPSLDCASPVEVARRFDEMWRELPCGLATTACLMVTPAALESVFNSPLPSSAPLRDREQLPFVVAVSRAAHYPRSELTPGEEDEDVFGRDFKGYFNVAVESLLKEFYPIVALDIMDLPRLTVGMRHEKDIWCHGHRGGVRHYVAEP
ncbi:uncharacterized protein CDV56_108386 [Aspergillus thermomutatus]|uniref:Uncharacterized protein n=1 Tax=Aspergillus thermomutatus TaxID=41047 RepID=A0A397HYW4_ASPTH|nr:uncharacterized protein CDV56_108386 [Aspergillus thermomutatus]RHZ66746.1 hypothetical protein CDV56_108386 [Aspergillus thermomutatus]